MPSVKEILKGVNNMTAEERFKLIKENTINDFKKCGLSVLFDKTVNGELNIPCRDGSVMKGFYFKPDTSGPFPTIAQRSCYPFAEPIYRIYGEQLAKRGFAYILQYCRGTGGSEGKWEPNINEPNDGADFIKYIDGLDWVMKIGYWGCSYLASTGWAITGSLTPKVKSMLLSHYGTERFTSAYKSGLFRHDILTAWAMGNAGVKIDADYLESCRFRPQIDVDKKLWGVDLPWYRDWISNTKRTDPYWNSGFWKNMSDRPKDLKIPVCIVEGWYDHHLGSAIQSFNNLSEESAKHSTFLVGCWNHGFNPCAEGRTQDHLENSEILQMTDWFKKTLLSDALPDRKVRWYIINDDSWREWGDYPKAGKVKGLYLSSDGKLGNDKTDVKDGTRSFVYDPEDPVMSHGAESLFTTSSEIGSLLQPEPEYRSDVKSFISEPLASDMTIIGDIKAQLYVSSDADDTAFTAKLMEILPDGKTYNIRGSIATLAYDEPYTKNSIKKLTVDMWDVAYKVKAGCRLRLDISSSDFPQYAIHPNRSGVWSEIAEMQKARQTIYCGSDHPSEIIIPCE
jgi:putative CocE/NonD family hydrolase